MPQFSHLEFNASAINNLQLKLGKFLSIIFVSDTKVWWIQT